MNWIEIDKNNLPENEVLAVNAKPFTYGYKEFLFGYLVFEDQKFVCENEYQILENCTHYIDVENNLPVTNEPKTKT